MGHYTFIWEHTAQEVYVTGTFDDWNKTIKLQKDGGVFNKTVDLPKTRTQYKFVVDGNWCINESARKEDDGHGIINNVLLPEDFRDEPVHTLSSAAPESSTAALAGAVPKMQRTHSAASPVPGAFPMTPAAETPGSEPQTFNIAPIPATAGPGNPVKLAPGEPVPAPSTLTDNTIKSTVKDDEELQEPSAFSVAPIPATAGAGNPIHLAPGEKVPDPSTFTSNTIHSTAKTDAASYDKANELPPLAFTPETERDAKGGMFSLPPISGTMIPESSLPMGVDAKTEQDTGVTIQSAAPTSTTAALAGLVPKEPHGVPETVIESQKEAEVSPEASANPEAVQEKKEVEQELKDKIPEAPAAADNSVTSNVSSNAQTAAASVAAGITAGAGAFAAAIYSAKDKAAETVGLNGSATAADVKDKAAETAGLNGSATTRDVKDKSPEVAAPNGSLPPAGDVPLRVVESQKEAHVSPEASSNPEAVHGKSQLEQELLSEVPKSTEHGSSAPAIMVPAVVAESQKEAHASPEATANPEAVIEKRAVESELLSEIPKSNEAGEPAPVITAATTAFAPGEKTETVKAAHDVPAIVAESQTAAHTSPEAAANPEAVKEKQAVETQLLEEVKPSTATGESAPTAVATTSTKAAEPPAPESFITHKPEPSSSASDALNATGESAPTPVATTSTKAAEPAAPQTSVDHKPEPSSSTSGGLNAPASKPAQPATSKPIDSTTDVAFNKAEPKAAEQTAEQSQPTVTTGVETTTTEAKSTNLETPVKDERRDSDISPKGTPGTQSLASAATDDKKKKRRSIFGRLKEKLSSKN